MSIVINLIIGGVAGRGGAAGVASLGSGRDARDASITRKWKGCKEDVKSSSGSIIRILFSGTGRNKQNESIWDILPVNSSRV